MESRGALSLLDGSGQRSFHPTSIHVGSGEDDVVVCTMPAGAMRLRGAVWERMVRGLGPRTKVRGYSSSGESLRLVRRGERIVGAVSAGIHRWSESRACWELEAQPFEAARPAGFAPAWAADLIRTSSVMVRGFAESPWKQDEWLVCGDAGIVAVSRSERRWLYRRDRAGSARGAALISSIAVRGDAVFVGFHRATPEAATLVLQHDSATFVGLPH
jgi:hypothetical protein